MTKRKGVPTRFMTATVPISKGAITLSMCEEFARPKLMSYEERRKIIEAPMPTITIHNHSRSHAGTMVVDDKVSNRQTGRYGNRRFDPTEGNE